MEHTYEVSGMKCGECITKVRRALESVANIKSVKVQLNPANAKVVMDKHTPLKTLNDAIEKVGNYTLMEQKEHRAVVEAGESLTPLFIIVAYIFVGVLIRAFISDNFLLHSLMSNFMGGFFVLFSLFKMLDLSGFAEGYSTYDIIAKRSKAYALAYPFIELTLGILYFTSFAPFFTNIATLVLMGIGSIGVFQALRSKRDIQCACLGAVLKLPMTKVTLIEDLLMALMALIMLLGF